MKTIDLHALPPDVVAALEAGETVWIKDDDRVAAKIDPGDPFAIVDEMRELFKDASEEELIAQTEFARRR